MAGVSVGLWLTLAVGLAEGASSKPNIIIITADDLGWNDVGFHGSNQIPTPNIDALAYSGVILRDYYTQPICTPARSALLTGRHPIHNGMENYLINAPEPWGLPLEERILPQYLQDEGYMTRVVGKWHLGFFKSTYTPTRRGFHSFYGIWLGHQDHYTHFGYEPHPGFDFHRGLNASWEAHGKYSTDLFTEESEKIILSHNTDNPLFLFLSHTAPHAPLQAPHDYVQKFHYIPDKKRQIFAAMVAKLDESVGKVTEALRMKNMLNNSIILFLTDNGGATNGYDGNVASNWPLRGCKDTLWEGGVRGVGLIWSPLLQGTPRVHQGLVNVQDWLPTLITAINASTIDYAEKLDGVSQWAALKGEADPPYSTMLHNIDPVRKIAALRHQNWKIIIGRTYNGTYDGFYGKLTGKMPTYDLKLIRESAVGKAVETSPSPLPPSSDILSLRARTTVTCQQTSGGETPHVVHVRQVQIKNQDESDHLTTGGTHCQPELAPCLFNVKDDPCEMNNVASLNQQVVYQLVGMLQAYQLTTPNNKPPDPRSYPQHWNNTWVPWQDFLSSN